MRRPFDDLRGLRPLAFGRSPIELTPNFRVPSSPEPENTTFQVKLDALALVP
jgi:hypothetical protein